MIQHVSFPSAFADWDATKVIRRIKKGDAQSKTKKLMDHIRLQHSEMSCFFEQGMSPDALTEYGYLFNLKPVSSDKQSTIDSQPDKTELSPSIIIHGTKFTVRPQLLPNCFLVSSFLVFT
jgi:hypothetical protein